MTEAARSILGDVERAREVVQETFLKLWRADPTRHEDHLAPWLFRVCRNRSLDVRGRAAREAPLDVAPRPAPGPSPAAQAANREDSRRLLAAVEALPARQREVLRLRLLEGLSYREIAEVTGLKEGHVGYLLHHAIRGVRERLDHGRAT